MVSRLSGAASSWRAWERCAPCRRLAVPAGEQMAGMVPRWKHWIQALLAQAHWQMAPLWLQGLRA